MKRQSGFTLIELIIVIVILGILAVTAAPQFFNFGGDARSSTVRGMEGSVKAAADLVYARSAIDGNEGEIDASVTLSGTGTVSTIFGYPAASAAGIIAAINADFGTGDAADNENDWYYTGGSSDAGDTIFIRPRGQEENTGCQVEYTAADGDATDGMSARSSVTVDVSGC